MLTHTCTRHTHACNVHTPTMLTHMHELMHAHTHNTHMHKLMHAHTYAHPHVQFMHAHAHTCAHTGMHTPTHAHPHSCMHTLMHVDAHACGSGMSGWGRMPPSQASCVAGAEVREGPAWEDIVPLPSAGSASENRGPEISQLPWVGLGFPRHWGVGGRPDCCFISKARRMRPSGPQHPHPPGQKRPELRPPPPGQPSTPWWLLFPGPRPAPLSCAEPGGLPRARP